MHIYTHELDLQSSDDLLEEKTEATNYRVPFSLEYVRRTMFTVLS